MSVAQERYQPWPVRELRARLSSGDTLLKLCGPKAATAKHDVREGILEALVGKLMADHFGGPRVMLGKRIGRTLGLRGAPFPSQAKPDIAVNLDGEFYICEVKSNRTDYNRFDDVLDDGPFKEYLASRGHNGPDPWEVEQDLIKLRLFCELSDHVRSCLFIMVDAYAGSGRAWANIFADRPTFQSTMRTEMVRSWTDDLLAATNIESISGSAMEAKLIVCEVRPTTACN